MTKKTMIWLLFPLILILLLISLFFLPTPKKIDSKPQTIEISAEEFAKTLNMKYDETEKHLFIDFISFKNGDKIIINDTIDSLTYQPSLNITTVEFNVNTHTYSGELIKSITFNFEGRITDEFKRGDPVKITFTIKHVSFTQKNWSYDVEVYEENWDQDFYVNHFFTQILPRSSISK